MSGFLSSKTPSGTKGIEQENILDRSNACPDCAFATQEDRSAHDSQREAVPNQGVLLILSKLRSSLALFFTNPQDQRTAAERNAERWIFEKLCKSYRSRSPITSCSNQKHTSHKRRSPNNTLHHQLRRTTRIRHHTRRRRTRRRSLNLPIANLRRQPRARRPSSRSRSRRRSHSRRSRDGRASSRASRGCCARRISTVRRRGRDGERAAGAVAGAVTELDEVRTGESGCVGAVNDDGLIAKVVRTRRVRAQEQLCIARLERSHRDIPMLARQIARLTSFRRCGGAGVVLPAVGGVEVAHCACAVSVGGDGEGVDVVDEWAIGGFAGEVGEVGCDDDAGAVGGDGEGDAACDCAAGEGVEVGAGEGGAEGEAGGVLLDGGVAEEALKGC